MSIPDLLTERKFIFASSSSLVDSANGEFPIPSLRSLALQQLVLNKLVLNINCSLEEELPGQGYKDLVRSMRLLTRDCLGDYQMTGLEESLVYDDGREVLDQDLAAVRPKALNYDNTIQVVKKYNSLGPVEWKIGKSPISAAFSINGGLLLSCDPAGKWLIFRIAGEREDVFTPMSGSRGWVFQQQSWIEGSSLVAQTNEKKEPNDFGQEESNRRKVATFGHNMFLYQEKKVFTWRSSTDNYPSYSYTYKVKAWFNKT